MKLENHSYFVYTYLFCGVFYILFCFYVLYPVYFYFLKMCLYLISCPQTWPRRFLKTAPNRYWLTVTSVLLTWPAWCFFLNFVLYSTKNQCCGSGIRDPVSGADPGSVMGKNQNPGSGSGMNLPDYFSESLETVFRVKYTWILWCGSGSGIFLTRDRGSGAFLTPGSGIRDGKKNSDPGSGSGMNIPD
jgi:hypothetical protein